MTAIQKHDLILSLSLVKYISELLRPLSNLLLLIGEDLMEVLSMIATLEIKKKLKDARERELQEVLTETINIVWQLSFKSVFLDL